MVLSYLCSILTIFLHGSHITPRTDFWALRSILYTKTFATSQTEVTNGFRLFLSEKSITTPSTLVTLCFKFLSFSISSYTGVEVSPPFSHKATLRSVLQTPVRHCVLRKVQLCVRMNCARCRSSRKLRISGICWDIAVMRIKLSSRSCSITRQSVSSF